MFLAGAQRGPMGRLFGAEERAACALGRAGRVVTREGYAAGLGLALVGLSWRRRRGGAAERERAREEGAAVKEMSAREWVPRAVTLLFHSRVRRGRLLFPSPLDPRSSARTHGTSSAMSAPAPLRLLGGLCRGIGKAVDAVGATLQGRLASPEKGETE